MDENKEPTDHKPMMNPYVFTFLLFAFGLWCFWDGWLGGSPDMEDYVVTMNRVASLILIPWSVWDFFKVRKRSKSDGRDPDN